MERLDEAGLSLGLDAGEAVENIAQVAGVAARRDVKHCFLTEAGEPRGVALLDEEPRERGDELAGMGELRFAGAGESHGGASIEHEISPQVRIGLEFLEVIAVRARVNVPVRACGCRPPAHICGTRRTRRSNPCAGCGAGRTCSPTSGNAPATGCATSAPGPSGRGNRDCFVVSRFNGGPWDHKGRQAHTFASLRVSSTRRLMISRL